MSKKAPKASLRERRKLLRAFRKEAGLTLVQLAERSGLSHPMLSQFETGDRNLSEEAYERVLAAIEKYLLETNANLRAEIVSAEKTAQKLGATVAPQPDSNEALATLIEGTSAGPLGQFLGDMLAPNRPGAFERYKANCKPVVQERERLVSRLENATSIDDPIVQEIIESFRREIAELKGEQPGLASCLLLFQSAATGRKMTDPEFADAIAASDRVKKLKAAIKAEDSDE